MIKLVLVGLGNYGKEFQFSRHNLGQDWLNYLVTKYQLSWTEHPACFTSLFSTPHYQLLLVKGKNYMNHSGEFLKTFLNNSEWENWPVMIVLDNLHLPFGKVKLSSYLHKNGHNGSLNIVQNFFTDKFLTIYLGIGKANDLKKWVLSKFNEKEINHLQTILFPDLSTRLFRNWLWWNKSQELLQRFFLPLKEKQSLLLHLAVIGGQWGDEGKGKIVDYFANKDFQIVARFSGGDNAGHTVYLGTNKYKFSILPVSILQTEKISLLGRNCLINMEQLVKELAFFQNRQAKINLKISGQAQLIMPYHLLLDEIQENKLENNKIGTTKRGIGPCWEDKVARIGLQIDDLFHPEYFASRLQKVLTLKNKILQEFNLALDFATVKRKTYQLFAKIKPYVDDVFQYLHCQKADKRILFEGAQGTLLDINFGAFPFVTSSGTVAAHVGACFGNVVAQTKFLGVFKAYFSRVGAGIFPTENTTPQLIKQHFVERGNEYGSVTKRRRRVGWFDAVLAKYACQINNFQELALTLLDVLSGLEKVKICIGYKYQNRIYNQWTPALQYLSHWECQYLVLDGWKEDLSNCTNYFQLPNNAKKYIATIEKLLSLPVKVISVGKRRDQTILINA